MRMESFGKQSSKKPERSAIEQALNYGRSAIFGVAALAGGYEAGALRASLLQEPSVEELGINMEKWKDVEPTKNVEDRRTKKPHIEDHRTKKPHDERLAVAAVGPVEAAGVSSSDATPPLRSIDEELRRIGYDEMPPAEPLPPIDTQHMPR